MTKNNFIKYLIIVIGILTLSFSLTNFCLASPLQLILPGNGDSDVPVDSYFQWDSVSTAVKYILDIDQFTQSEDNILPSVCSGGVCSFGFLDLTIGNINYLTAYTWRVTAYNAAGDNIDSSPTFSFTTEQDPSPHNGNGNGGGGAPISLINPLKCKTLECAFDALFNFLFFLAMALGPLLIIYAAFLMLTAAGNVERVNKGKTIILWTLIAIAIILLAKGIPSIMKGAFGG